VPRLLPEDVACWVIKSSRAPGSVAPGWLPGTVRELDRCVRRSYRLDLMRPGQPCLLWVSGRQQPGVHALGELSGPAAPGDGGPVVAVRFTRLAEPVDRAELLADPAVRDAEVLRMPAGSNPSYLSPSVWAVLVEHLDPSDRAAAGW
jgi:hypothetical protein